MKSIEFPSIIFRKKRFDKSASIFIVVFGLLFVLLLPILINREAGPDALTLWNSYARADSCDFWSPFSDSRSSYECTAYVLRPTGIDLKNAWTYGLACNFLLTFLPFLFFRRIPFSIFAAMLAWASIRGFFLENLTKEILVAVTVIIILVGALRKHAVVGILAAGLMYGIMIRPYWVLASATWVGLVIIRPRLSKVRFILLLFLYYLLAALAIHGVLGGTLTGFRQSSNEMRTLGEEGSRSLIVSIFNGGDVISQTIDTILIFFRLAFPVELIKLSGPSQIVFVSLTAFTVVQSIRLFVEDKLNRSAATVMAFPIAFLMVQAIFEPDFGSFARHFSMIAPIAFAGMGLYLSHRVEA